MIPKSNFASINFAIKTFLPISLALICAMGANAKIGGGNDDEDRPSEPNLTYVLGWKYALMLNQQLNTNLGLVPMSKSIQTNSTNPLEPKTFNFIINANGLILEVPKNGNLEGSFIHPGSFEGVAYSGLLTIGTHDFAMDQNGFVHVLESLSNHKGRIPLNAEPASFMFSAFGTLFLGYVKNGNVLIKALLTHKGKIHKTVSVRIRPTPAITTSNLRFQFQDFKRTVEIFEYLSDYTPSPDFSPVIPESAIDYFPNSQRWNLRDKSLIGRAIGLLGRVAPTTKVITVDHFAPVLKVKSFGGETLWDVMHSLPRELPSQIQAAIAKALDQDPPQPSSGKPEEKSRSCFQLAR